MKALSELAKDALELPVPQRLILARILLDLCDGADSVSTEAQSEWEEEIKRRLRAVEDGSAQSQDAGEVFAELDRRFPS